MKRVALAVLALALAAGWVAGLAGCRTSDIRTVVIAVPDMKNAACQKLIANSLATTDGIFSDAVVFDLEKRTVTVRYDSMKLAIKNIEHQIAKLGFSTADIPADPAARAALPAECQ